MKRKLIYIFISILILVSLFSFGTANAQTAALTFDAPASAMEGSELVVRSVMNLDGMLVGAFDFYITYDSTYLEYKECRSMFKPSGADNDIYDLGGSLIGLYAGINSASSVQNGQTVLYELVFTVKKNLPDKNVLFSYSDIVLNDDTSKPIESRLVTSKAAEVSIRNNVSTDATLKSVSLSSGTLSPSFSSTVTDYNISVENTVDKITISGVPNDANATVVSSQILNAPLTVGNNSFSLTVRAESGTEKTYNFTVERQKSSVNTLSRLEVTGGSISPSFSSSTYAYSLTVPYTTSSVTISAGATASTASIDGTGAKTLSVGSNTFNIVVTAENGEKKTYSVTVNRTAPSTDASLKSISLSSGSLSPAFDPSVTEYNVVLPNEIEKITVTGTQKDSFATVAQPTADKALVPGETAVLQIEVTAQDGTRKTYKINVTRQKSSVNTLSSLSVSGASISFSPSVSEYTVTVPYTTEKVNITATAAASTATLFGTGEKALSVGDNRFDITVTAENGDKKIYSVTVKRTAPSKDSTLKSLAVSNGALSPSFSSSVKDYTVAVPYYITEVTLSFEANDTKNKGVSVASPIRLSLTAGSPVTQNITVTAEDGSQSTYKVTVTRALPSTDATLSKLVPSSGTSGFAFRSDVTDYTITVPFEVDVISFDFETNYPEATAGVSAGTKYPLSENETNLIVIPVTAEDKTTKKEYRITVIREKCSDSSLKSLVPAAGELSPAFSADVHEYTLNVLYAVEKMGFDVITNHSTASFEVIGSEELETGENMFRITVTAEDQSQSEYTINVVRGEASSDNTLKSITPSTGKLNETFSSEKYSYTIAVPYTTESINFECVANDPTAKINYSGNTLLNVGDNEYLFTVTAENGDELEYRVVVSRTAPSAINTLKMLEPSIGRFEESFMPSKVSYAMEVPYTVEHIDFSYSATNSFASVELIGNNDLEVGINSFTVVVTAQNNAVRKYSIKVTRREPSDNASLEYLIPSVGKLYPEFDPETTEYEIILSNKYDSIEFEFDLADEFAEVKATGTSELTVNEESIFTFEVTAEAGNIKIYTVKVLRQDISSDNTLKNITVTNGLFEFDGRKYEYNVRIPIGTENVEINYETSNEEATAVLEGPETISIDEENLYTITVTAENGDTAVYKLNISFREVEDNCDIAMITDENGFIEFTPGVTEYKVTVPYVVEQFRFSYVLDGLYSSAEEDIPEELIAGEYNDHIIKVTAENGDEKVYKIRVFRSEKSSDSTLASLTVDGIEETLEFSPSVKTYFLTVPYATSKISILYDVNDEFATAEESFAEELAPGENNEYNITVIAEDGSESIYKIFIFRMAVSDDSKLSSFTNDASGTEPDFSPEVFHYFVVVPYSTDKVNVEYTVSSKLASAVLEAPETLEVGDNVYYVTVTAEDESTSVYTLTVTRLKKNSDSTLSSLVPSEGSISFDPAETEYYIELDNKIEEITFDFAVNSIYSSCVMTGNTKLEENVPEEFLFTVTAEDESVTVYKVTVFRKPLSDNKTIKKIIINGKETELGSDAMEISVGYDTVSLDVSAFAEDPKAKVTVEGTDELVPGENMLYITVTAENGTEKKYPVKVIRDAGSSNAYLSSLRVKDFELNEAFDKGKLSYTLTVEPDIARIAVIADVEDYLSECTVSDTTLRVGENTITVKVISQNGAELEYSILVTREKETFEHFVMNRVLFTIGDLKVNVAAFGLAAIALICVCIVIIVFAIMDKAKKNKGKHQ